MTVTYPISFSLNLDDERERRGGRDREREREGGVEKEREKEERESKMPHITLSFKTFCGLQFSNHLAATSNITAK